ncbi:unnamed protein product [Allacma fusca]|uniref:Uncharacterized protein n=1 Tax=Allacma fusca TaxID=39272 RepID=A0A8J2L0S1_9HEXA|nr:unnamed protein product [Allacma fusca]
MFRISNYCSIIQRREELTTHNTTTLFCTHCKRKVQILSDTGHLSSSSTALTLKPPNIENIVHQLLILSAHTSLNHAKSPY